MPPSVSVIIPIYNTSQYLNQCLDSILSQTLTDIEIICVDDGSTDNSLDILNDYKLKDSRITVLQQKNKGGGAARNLGMSIARGKYLSFLDSDDFFDSDMLQSAYEYAEKHDADVTIFQFRVYYDNLSTYSLRKRGLSNSIDKNINVVSRNEHLSSIFSLTNPAPWNKLYKREFVESHKLMFQEIAKSNDVYFGFTTLYFAEKIALLDKCHVSYRTGTKTNTQATTYKNPCDVYYALLAVYEYLKDTPSWTVIEKGFVNNALRQCIFQLDKLRRSSPNAFNELCSLLNSEGYDKLKISKYSKEDFECQWDFRQYQNYLSWKNDGECSLPKKIFRDGSWQVYHIGFLIQSYMHLLKTQGLATSIKEIFIFLKK